MTSDDAAARNAARRHAEAGATEGLFDRIIDRLGGNTGVRTVFGEPIGAARSRSCRSREPAGSSAVAVAADRTARRRGDGWFGGGGAAGVSPVGFLEIRVRGGVQATLTPIPARCSCLPQVWPRRSWSVP